MSDSDDETTALVYDIGSGKWKGGFAGDDSPNVLFPSVIGRVRQEEWKSILEEQGKPVKDYYIGHPAIEMRDYLSISHPIQHGLVTDWDDMEKVGT